MRKLAIFFSIVVAVITLSVAINQSIDAQPIQIKDGSTVSATYGLMADGAPVVSASGREVMQLVVGRGIFPAQFEKQLIGLKEGDKKVITLRPNDAYGPTKPELVRRIPKSVLPKNFNAKEGDLIGTRNGQAPMRLVKFLDDSIIVDQNHPLAGKTLTYTVQIMDVQ